MNNPLLRLVAPYQVPILERLIDATRERPPLPLIRTVDGVAEQYGTRVGFRFADGGRKAAGYTGLTGDCGVRALAIAVFGARPDVTHDAQVHRIGAYNDAVAVVLRHAKSERITKARKTKSTTRTGIRQPTFRRIMVELGWSWRPTMAIGGGCTTHLRADELPSGTIIVAVSKHYCAVIDGVVHDTYCDDRDGTRCVYGYWFKSEGA